MRRGRALGLAAAWLLGPAPVAADERFEALRRQAEPLESLPGFVSRYVGECRDPAAREACEAGVRAARRAAHGRLFATVVSEQARRLVRVERRGAGHRFLFTPFLDAEGYGLTHGEPRLDGSGRPAVGLIAVDAAPGVEEAAIDAALRTGRIELEILFRPEGAWKLRRRGEPGFLEGVRARFAAVRLVDGRTGAELGVKLP
jgi:hypothetical protein